MDDDSDNDNAFDSYVDTFGQIRVLFDDREPDCPEARERFIKERQQPGVTYSGITHGRYDSSKDWDEGRRMKTALARLPSRR